MVIKFPNPGSYGTRINFEVAFPLGAGEACMNLCPDEKAFPLDCPVSLTLVYSHKLGQAMTEGVIRTFHY